MLSSALAVIVTVVIVDVVSDRGQNVPPRPQRRNFHTTCPWISFFFLPT